MPPTLTFELRALPPFRLDLTVWALRRRAENRVDSWDGRHYRRLLVINGRPRALTVAQASGPDSPNLEVRVDGPDLSEHEIPALSLILTRMLGLDVNLSGFYRLAAADPVLAPLADRFRGLKPPRFPTVFEAVVNAVACQQISLDFGIRLLNRLAEAFGPALEVAGQVLRGFPAPEDLASRQVDELRVLGFSRQKARAVCELAGAVAGGLDLEGLAEVDGEAAAARLRRLRGVGRWTAEYALLRGLGRLDVFPGDDVGARNNLRRWLGLGEPLDYARTKALAGRWQPYAGLVYFHLLLERLEGRGLVSREYNPVGAA
jgi:DNA-3-methyladenine glycosylase II